MPISYALKRDDFKSYDCVKSGIYQYRVVDCFETISHANNQQFAIDLKVWVKGNKKVWLIKDYLVFTESGIWKPRRHFISAGKLDIFLKGRLSCNDVIDNTGYLLASKKKYFGVFQTDVINYLTEQEAFA